MVSRENTPQRRLPPKVASRKKKGTKRSKPGKQPWYRHTPWVVSLAACGVFIVLIGGFFGMRQVVILVRGNNSEATSEDEKQNESTNSSVADNAASASNQLAGKGANSKTTDEPTLEVLPPKAAMQPGRKLPKMLLVGRGTNMFPQLAEAMKVAIGGDIIEIRTNGPLLLKNRIVWNGTGGILTLRGGRGFQPIITRSYPPTTRTMLIFSGKYARVVLQNLTFVITRSQTLTASCPIDISDCCFVGPGSAAILKSSAGADARVNVQNCFFYGSVAIRITGEDEVSIQNNLFVNVDLPVQLPGSRADMANRSVVCFHNTFIRCRRIFGIVSCRGRIRNTDNLIAHGPWDNEGFLEVYPRCKSLPEAQSRIAYQGRRNLFYQSKWQWFGTIPVEKSFAGWQRLTKNGERNPIFADPLFVNPQLVMQAKDRILPPKAFALRPNSPAKRRATDGTDIGCDLSKIPIPPPMVQKMMTQILQKKKKIK